MLNAIPAHDNYMLNSILTNGKNENFWASAFNENLTLKEFCVLNSDTNEVTRYTCGAYNEKGNLTSFKKSLNKDGESVEYTCDLYNQAGHLVQISESVNGRLVTSYTDTDDNSSSDVVKKYIYTSDGIDEYVYLGEDAISEASQDTSHKNADQVNHYESEEELNEAIVELLNQYIMEDSIAKGTWNQYSKEANVIQEDNRSFSQKIADFFKNLGYKK